MTTEEALLAWWSGRAQEFSERWFGPDQGELFRGVDRELGLLDALVLVAGDASDPAVGHETALVLARLWPLWTARDLAAVAGDSLRTLAGAGGPSGRPADRAEIAWSRAWIAINTMRIDEASDRAADLRGIAEVTGATRDRAAHRQIDGIVALYRGRRSESRRLLERAASLHEGGDDPAALVLDLTFLASAETLDGEASAAHAHLDTALELCRARGDQWLRNYVLWAAAVRIWEAGDRVGGQRLARDGIVIAAETGDRYAAATYFEVIADFEAQQGRLTRAATLTGASDRLWRDIGSMRDLWNSAASRRRTLDVLSSAMDPSAFRVAHAQGALRAMSPAGWVPLADAADERERPLTPRQREVADLIARGWPNKRIAEALGVAERTIEMHVANLFARLHVGSRAQIAAWVAGRGDRPAGR